MSLNSFIFHLGLRIDQRLAASGFLKGCTGKSKIIFFPGCSLAAYNPDYVRSVQDFIKERQGECEVFMACCAKPLKLMGDKKAFNFYNNKIVSELEKTGAETVITACQNCFKSLSDNNNKFKVLSLWPLMLKLGLKCLKKYDNLEVSVQDSCVTRDTAEIAASVREILRSMGVKVHEMDNCAERAKCCGGIRMISTGSVKTGRDAMRRRAAESKCDTIVSYCASCRSAMGISNKYKSLHILDLIFGNGEAVVSKNKIINRFKTAHLK